MAIGQNVIRRTGRGAPAAAIAAVTPTTTTTTTRAAGDAITTRSVETGLAATRTATAFITGAPLFHIRTATADITIATAATISSATPTLPVGIIAAVAIVAAAVVAPVFPRAVWTKSIGSRATIERPFQRQSDYPHPTACFAFTHANSSRTESI